MLKKILLALALLLIALAIVVSIQPSEFRITRETTIAASNSTIYPHINSQRAWEKWSPWAKIDPHAKFTYEGPDAGIGSIARWEGNMEVGAGSSTIIETREDAFVKFQLDFIKPMAGTSYAEFQLTPSEQGTNVSWTMYGQNNFMAKAVSLFIDCEKMMSEMFDQGLANLKTLTETEEAVTRAVPAPTEEELAPTAMEELTQPQPVEPDGNDGNAN